jgi:hypothetical protein
MASWLPSREHVACVDVVDVALSGCARTPVVRFIAQTQEAVHGRSIAINEAADTANRLKNNMSSFLQDAAALSQRMR